MRSLTDEGHSPLVTLRQGFAMACKGEDGNVGNSYMKKKKAAMEVGGVIDLSDQEELWPLPSFK